MLESKYYLKRQDVLFYFAWILFLCSTLFEQTSLFLTHQNSFSVLTKGIRYFSYLVFGFKVIYSSQIIKKRFAALIVYLFMIFAISCIASTNRTMLLYLFVLLAAIQVDSHQIIKLTVWIQGIALAVVVGLSQVGVLEDYIFGKEVGRLRHGLGFSWTTTGPILYFYFLLGYVYLKKEKFNLGQALILELINLVFFVLTNTKMAFVLSSLFLLYFALKGHNCKKTTNEKHSSWHKIWLGAPAIFCLLAFLSANYYSPTHHILHEINKFISNRLQLGQDAIQKYGFTLFGQPIKWMGFDIMRPSLQEMGAYNYVDSSYLQMALEYGLLFVLVIVGLYTYGIYRAIKDHDSYLLAIYLIILFFSLVEPRLMNLAFNPFPLVIFSKMCVKRNWRSTLEIKKIHSFNEI